MPRYEEGADLAEYIQAAIDEFVMAREHYWDHQEKEPEARFIADFTGRLLVEAAFTLSDPTPDSEAPDVPWESHLDAARSERFGAEVREAIQLRLATELQSDLGAMTSRCEELSEELFGNRPGPRVMKFLQRLTRCYVAGFFPECVILCRSVLESAVRERFEMADLDLPENEKGHSDMRTKLNAAERFGLISAKARKDAWMIWIRGNRAIHEDIRVTKDVVGTIAMTRGVLAEIYG